MKSNTQRNVLCGVALLCTALTSGGLIQGWGPLHSLLEEKFAESRLQVVFNLGYVSLSLASVIFGLALDVIGPRYTSAISMIISVIGNLLMAHTDYIEIAFCLIAAGGIGAYLGQMNFGNLFKHNTLFISCNTAAFNLAAFNYMMITWFESSRKSFFYYYSYVPAFFFVLIVVMYPDDAYKPGEHAILPLTRWLASNCHNDLPKDQVNASILRDPTESSDGDSDIVEGSLSEQLKRKDLWGNVVFYSIILFIMSFIGGLFPDLVKQRAQKSGVSDKDLKLMQDTLYTVLGNGLCVFFNIVAGVTIEKWGLPASFFFTIFNTQVMLALALVQSFWIQAASFVMYAAQKSFLFPSFMSLLLDRFPLRYYGTLVALCTLAAAIVGLGAVPLVKASNQQYTWPLVGLIIVTMPLYGYIITLKQPQTPPKYKRLDDHP